MKEGGTPDRVRIDLEPPRPMIFHHLPLHIHSFSLHLTRSRPRARARQAERERAAKHRPFRKRLLSVERYKSEKISRKAVFLIHFPGMACDLLVFLRVNPFSLAISEMSLLVKNKSLTQAKERKTLKKGEKEWGESA